MAFSFGLLAKGLVGVLSVGTPIAVGIYYKDDILGKNKETSNLADGSKTHETGGDNSNKNKSVDSQKTDINSKQSGSEIQNPTPSPTTGDNNPTEPGQGGTPKPSPDTGGGSQSSGNPESGAS